MDKDKQNKSGENRDSHAGSEREQSLKNTRRRLIVGGGIIGASGSIPEKWTSSLVETVVLPAHAATTDDTGSNPGTPTPSPSPAPSPTPTLAPTTSAPVTMAPVSPPMTEAPVSPPMTPAPGAPMTPPN